MIGTLILGYTVLAGILLLSVLVAVALFAYVEAKFS